MEITSTKLPEVLLITLNKIGDNRGFFYECYRKEVYRNAGIPEFVQDNFSHSQKNVLRGMHYQQLHTQGKLVWVTRGKVFDVALDVRQGSPRFGQWIGVTLDAENPQQFYIPPGFAHGFCTLTDNVDFHYKCTDYYHPASEIGIAWDDPDIGIKWPIKNPTLSAKDKTFPRLSEIDQALLPTYK